MKAQLDMPDLFGNATDYADEAGNQGISHATLTWGPFEGTNLKLNEDQPIDELGIDPDNVAQAFVSLIANFEKKITEGKIKRTVNGLHQAKITFDKNRETGIVFAKSDQPKLPPVHVGFEDPEIIRNASGNVETTVYVQRLLPHILSPHAMLMHDWTTESPQPGGFPNKISPFRMKPGYHKTKHGTIAPTRYNDHGVIQAVIPFMTENGWGAMSLANFKKPIPFTLFSRLSGVDKKPTQSLNDAARAKFLWSMTLDIDVFPVLMCDRRTNRRKSLGKLHSQWDGNYRYLEPANT